MAIAVDASTPSPNFKRSTANNAAASIVTASFSPPANSMVVIMFAIGWTTTPGSSTMSCADSAAVSYTAGPAVSSFANFCQVGIFTHYYSSAPGSITVTPQTTEATIGKSMTMAIQVLTGVNSTQTSPGTATATTAMRANLTTTVTGSMVYCAAGNGNTGTITANAQTTQFDGWSESGAAVCVAAGGSTSATGGSPGSTSFGWSSPTTQIFAGLEILPSTASIAAPPIDVRLRSIANRRMQSRY